MKLKEKNYVIIAAILGIIISLILFIGILLILNNNPKQEQNIDDNNPTTNYYCNIQEDRIRQYAYNLICSSNSDCDEFNMICDSNTHKCIEANINLRGEIYIPITKEKCEEYDGLWENREYNSGTQIIEDSIEILVDQLSNNNVVGRECLEEMQKIDNRFYSCELKSFRELDYRTEKNWYDQGARYLVTCKCQY